MRHRALITGIKDKGDIHLTGWLSPQGYQARGQKRCVSQCRKRGLAGFTLIEMLIVVTIIGLLASLVAPFGARVLERARAQQEWISAQRTVDRLTVEAFLSGKEVVVRAEGDGLSWQIGSSPKIERRYEHLSFSPAQEVRINTSGFADSATIAVLQGRRRAEIRLNYWVDGSSS